MKRAIARHFSPSVCYQLAKDKFIFPLANFGNGKALVKLLTRAFPLCYLSVGLGQVRGILIAADYGLHVARDNKINRVHAFLESLDFFAPSG